jgi:hypothetical protein
MNNLQITIEYTVCSMLAQNSFTSTEDSYNIYGNNPQLSIATLTTTDPYVLYSQYGNILSLSIKNKELDAVENINFYLSLLNRGGMLTLENVMIDSIDCRNLSVLNLSNCFVGLIIKRECCINKFDISRILLICNTENDYLLNTMMNNSTVLYPTGTIENDSFQFKGFIDNGNPSEGIMKYKVRNDNYIEYPRNEMISDSFDSVLHNSFDLDFNPNLNLESTSLSSYILPLPLVHIGRFNGCKRIGVGITLCSDGSIFRGEYFNDKRNGYGEIIHNGLNQTYIWRDNICMGITFD